MRPYSRNLLYKCIAHTVRLLPQPVSLTVIRYFGRVQAWLHPYRLNACVFHDYQRDNPRQLSNIEKVIFPVYGSPCHKSWLLTRYILLRFETSSFIFTYMADTQQQYDTILRRSFTYPHVHERPEIVQCGVAGEGAERILIREHSVRHATKQCAACLSPFYVHEKAEDAVRASQAGARNVYDTEHSESDAQRAMRCLSPFHPNSKPYILYVLYLFPAPSASRIIRGWFHLSWNPPGVSQLHSRFQAFIKDNA